MPKTVLRSPDEALASESPLLSLFGTNFVQNILFRKIIMEDSKNYLLISV
jgi:hypothetical protein